jgi:uncharacterized protein (TIGR04255 family)
VAVALEFCAYEDVIFDDSPLVMVLTQVKFPPILSLMSPAGAAGFQAALRDEYPTMLPTTREAEFQVGPNSVGAQASAPVFKFADDTNEWKVGIASDFVSLETPNYSGIDEFLARFGRVLEVAERTVRPSESRRIGLRMVNSFVIDGADTTPLRDMLRSELLGVLAVERFPAPISASFTQTSFSDDENMLVLRYGLAEPDEGKTKFILDMDYVTERPYPVGGDTSIPDVLGYFNEGMTSFFHWALLDPYKDTLRSHPRERDVK